VAFDNPRVAVNMVNRVDAANGRIAAPTGGSPGSAKSRRDIRHGAGRQLRILAKGRQPAREERGDIGVVSGGVDEELRVAGPAGTFIALGAIRRHFEEIIALAPENVF